jgi:hypothetical protein
VSPECKVLPAVSRIASAAGALAITSVLLLAVGLGFPARASAEGTSRHVTAPGAVTAPAQAGAAFIARGPLPRRHGRLQ